MADFSALVNELKKNNSEEQTRDSRRLAQATAHNQDQNVRFEKLGATITSRNILVSSDASFSLTSLLKITTPPNALKLSAL